MKYLPIVFLAFLSGMLVWASKLESIEVPVNLVSMELSRLIDSVDSSTLNGQRVDIQSPSKDDWQFLKTTLENGSRSAQLSAARVLVEIGNVKAATMLVNASIADDTFFLYALEILRLERKEDVLRILQEVAHNRRYSEEVRSLALEHLIIIEAE